MDFIFLGEPWILLMRIFYAAALGAILGIERDIHGRQAGLRTHLLVSSGAALFFILSTNVATFDVVTPGDFTRVTDPGRIAAQIVTGIGFLGAGVILKEGLTVVGLTTSACLWISAAIGMAAGAGLYIMAASTTFLALFSLTLLRWIERFYRRDIYRDLFISMSIDEDFELVMEAIKNDEVFIIYFSLERDYEKGITNAKISLRLFCKGNADKLFYPIVKRVEETGISLKNLKWERP